MHFRVEVLACTANDYTVYTQEMRTDQSVMESDMILDDLHDHIQPGMVIEGKYRLQSFIGCGGIGITYRGEEILGQEFVREAAIKLVPSHKDDVDHQLGELRIAASLAHPHIVNCYHAGKTRIIGIELLYIVMELADGDLGNYLASLPSCMPLDEAFSLAWQISSGLEFMHEQTPPIVHFDIKPQNILHVGGSWKIADFGIARAMVAADLSTSSCSASNSNQQATYNTRSFAGTPRYSPPEARGEEKPLTAGWDTWAFGIVLHEALVGALPFRDLSMPAWRVKSEDADVSSVYGPAVPHTQLSDTRVSETPEDGANHRFVDTAATVKALTQSVVLSGLDSERTLRPSVAPPRLPHSETTIPPGAFTSSVIFGQKSTAPETAEMHARASRDSTVPGDTKDATTGGMGPISGDTTIGPENTALESPGLSTAHAQLGGREQQSERSGSFLISNLIPGPESLNISTIPKPFAKILRGCLQPNHHRRWTAFQIRLELTEYQAGLERKQKDQARSNIRHHKWHIVFSIMKAMAGAALLGVLGVGDKANTVYTYLIGIGIALGLLGWLLDPFTKKSRSEM